MSTPTSPTDAKSIPTRSNTVRSSMTAPTRRTSLSEDEAIPDSDSSEVRLYPCLCVNW